MIIHPYIKTPISTQFRLIRPKLGVVIEASGSRIIGYYDLRLLKVEISEEDLKRFGLECEDYRLGFRLTVPTMTLIASQNNKIEIK